MATGALAGYVATNSLYGAAIGSLAGLVPDIDEPNAKLGRRVRFLAKWLKRTFGHRTVTHSLIFVMLSAWATHMLFEQLLITKAVAAGLTAHIMCDIITGRVMLFYPLRMKIGIRVNKKWSKRIDGSAKWLAIGALLALVINNIMKELLVSLR